ncbi:nucleoside diphosphate kinase 7-like [Ctenocephalides felis]|uniref:nucleoside diphosphate kinase 7-like n=1 Tax=Ctenocephalides felis TaxID=7515 RepID=UPI000E6E3502|nr:nucleoside diphosphate kinase 7-like [Ctenocephalides felis]
MQYLHLVLEKVITVNTDNGFPVRKPWKSPLFLSACCAYLEHTIYSKLNSMQEQDFAFYFAFNTEWYDPTSRLRRKFIVSYYPADETVAMWDKTFKKKFLQRMNVGLKSEDFFVGNRITLNFRPMYIVSYANEFTKNYFSSRLTVTFALIKPNAAPDMGAILHIINSKGFRFVRLKMSKLTRPQARSVYGHMSSEDQMLAMLINEITSGYVIGMILAAENAIKAFMELIGPEDPADAKEQAPCSIRALYGQTKLKNAIYGSTTYDELVRDSAIFFPPDPTNGITNTVHLGNSTLCIIKPHAIKDQMTGAIIQQIQKCGFVIGAMQMFYMDKVNMLEYLDVYRNLHADYPRMVSSMIEGPLIAMEIMTPDNDPDIVQLFKDICGPSHPEKARRIKPWTLRAKFGQTRIYNAIHCTELPCDGTLEVCYFFKILEDLAY